MKDLREFCRSALEVLIAFLLLIVFLPVLLFAYVLTHITAGGPIFVTDEWLTGSNRVVRVLRFRTTGPGFPVFRTVGHLLRKYSIDEFPSLWSVMRREARFADLSWLNCNPK